MVCWFQLVLLGFCVCAASRLRHRRGNWKLYRKYNQDSYHRPYADPLTKSRLDKRPSFDPNVKSDITAHMDDPAYLHCKVKNQIDYKVAWIRVRDNNLLTVQKDIFTNDQRFYISYRETENDWCLVIKYVRANDSGVYECQLSTDPPQSFMVSLNVVEKVRSLEDGPLPGTTHYFGKNHATMKGPEQVFDGESIRLSCEIQLESPHDPPPDFIVWSVNDTLINVDDKQKYKTNRSERGLTVVHTLEVTEAKPEDTGTYTCKADNTPAQSMLIQVNSASTLNRIGYILMAISLWSIWR